MVLCGKNTLNRSMPIKLQHLGLLVLLSSISAYAFADNAINDCWAHAQTHWQVYTCLDQKIKAQQQNLNEAYQKAEASTQSFAPANPQLAKQLLANLQSSKENFDQYEKTQCNYVLAAGAGGSGAGDMKAGCMIDLMQSQTQLLENYLGAGS